MTFGHHHDGLTLELRSQTIERHKQLSEMPMDDPRRDAIQEELSRCRENCAKILGKAPLTVDEARARLDMDPL
jgi:hypothetical protein